MLNSEIEILKFIHDLNQCWTFGNPADLVNYFHEQMLAITPMDKFCRNGRTECVEGWAGFNRSTKISSWQESGHIVRRFGEAAVVAYDYVIEFAMNGKDYKEQGRDMFFLIRENGRWWAVADQFSSVPK
jgi:hypothetical protein